ncbi:hypothetical protein KABACHOK_05050 [Brevundimonas phage vB_BpoS-Kabachok]|uniref:Uncharacterized protein n=1 Tax=Brevundimonas phage vB_BpoS-Kabachok TaxID=2948600 RepID=A0A9E7SJE4_9CAUD|nr:hypothetical protein KABACHOK_05050 [Brevundimonas phage vB_BpoS-Kabachok]
MCIVSMVHDYGSKLPQDTWTLPGALPIFDDLVKKANEFDRLAKQPECFDAEKLKFLEEARAKLDEKAAKPPAPPELTPEQYRAAIAQRDRAYEAQAKAAQEIRAEADENLQRAKRAEAALAAATQENLTLKDDLKGANDAALKLREDYDHLIIAYARLASDAGLKVAACGSGEYFTQIDVELPTGLARFYVDNAYAPLLAGLPYGINEPKGPLDRETQALRLTQAYHPEMDQAPIPEPMTPDRVLAILDEPAAPKLDLSHIRFGVPQAKPQAVNAAALLTGAAKPGTTA